VILLYTLLFQKKERRRQKENKWRTNQDSKRGH